MTYGKIILTGSIAIVVAFIIFGIVSEAVAPTPIVKTKVVTKVETRTVVKEIEVYRTPQECIDALDVAGNGYIMLGNAYSDGLLTDDEANEITTYLDAETEELGRNSQTCRSHAKDTA